MAGDGSTSTGSGGSFTAAKKRLCNSHGHFIAALSNTGNMEALDYNRGVLRYIIDPDITDHEKRTYFNTQLKPVLEKENPSFEYIINAEFVTDFIQVKWSPETYTGNTKIHKGLGGLAFLQQHGKVIQDLESEYRKHDEATHKSIKDIDALKAKMGSIPTTAAGTLTWLDCNYTFWKILLREWCIPCLKIKDIKYWV